MASDETYILGKGGAQSIETGRLDFQHVFLRTLTGGLLPAELSSHLAKLPSSRIADVGTGTAAWLIDMAAHLPPTSSLVGFDVTEEAFPSPDDLPANLSLHKHNALEPFPDEHRGTYDLVHARLLMYGLKKGEWEVVARNMYGLLKPGGRLLWEETGYVSWVQIPPHPIVTEAMMIDQSFAKKIGRDVTHPWKLREQVEAAGFVDVSMRDNEDYDLWSSDAGKRITVGMYSASLRGIAAKGGIPVEEAERIIKGLEGIFDGSTVMGMQLRWVWGRRPE